MKYNDYRSRMWPQTRWYRCSSWVTVIRRSCWRCWGWHRPSGVTCHLLWRSLHRCCSLCRSCDWRRSSSWCLLKFSNLQEQVSTIIVYHDQSWCNGCSSPQKSWGQRYGAVLGRGQGKISTPFWSDVTWKFKSNIHLNPASQTPTSCWQLVITDTFYVPPPPKCTVSVLTGFDCRSIFTCFTMQSIQTFSISGSTNLLLNKHGSKILKLPLIKIPVQNAPLYVAGIWPSGWV